MIRILAHNEIDKRRWDDCVEHAPNGNIYALSWYLDVIHPGWEALVEDDYRAVMPLTGGKKLCVDYMYQPFFAQQLGVFSKDLVTEAQMTEFLSILPKKYSLVEIRLNTYNPMPSDNPLVERHRNCELRLCNDYATISAGYHNNTRRNLKKALKTNISIDDEVGVECIIALFRENKGREVLHWGDKEYARLSNLVEEAMRRGSCFLKGVTDHDTGRIIAGAVFMRYKNKVVFLFSGADTDAKSKHAMTFLIDHVIKECAGTGYILDFEGSDDDNLARYYLGFGAEEISYPGYVMNNINPIVQRLLSLWRRMRK